MSEVFQLKVRAIAELTPRIRSFELVPPVRGAKLPAFTAGAHLTVHLPSGLERQYSLCNDPAERHRYSIAVQRETTGRGGSDEMFRAVHVGDTLAVGAPRNLFPLHDGEDAEAVLIAGGIGVTPILAMARHLSAAGRRFSVLYLTRDAEETAFGEEFAALAAAGAPVTVHHDGGEVARAFNLAAFLGALSETAHVYCCGPAGLMKAVATLGEGRGERMHFEHFSNDEAAPRSGDQPFVVMLARSGRDIEIPADRTILATSSRQASTSTTAAPKAPAAPASPGCSRASPTIATGCSCRTRRRTASCSAARVPGARGSCSTFDQRSNGRLGPRHRRDCRALRHLPVQSACAAHLLAGEIDQPEKFAEKFDHIKYRRYSFDVIWSARDKSDPESTVDILIFGTISASILLLSSIGFSMVLKTEGFINVAHGQALLLGAYGALFLNQVGLPLWLAAILAALGCGVTGVVLNRFLFRPVKAQGILVLLFTSVGVAYVIYGVVGALAGKRMLAYDLPPMRAWKIAGQPFMTPYEMAIVALAIASALGVHVFLTYTWAGKSIRAVADNEDLARARGFNPGRSSDIVWFIATALAGLAGVFLGIVGSLHTQMGWQQIIMILAVTVLGGLGSIYGVMLASVVLAFGIEIGLTVVSSNYRTGLAFALIIVVLLVRPGGLQSLWGGGQVRSH